MSSDSDSTPVPSSTTVLPPVVVDMSLCTFSWDITGMEVYPQYGQFSNVVVRVKWTYTCGFQEQTASTNGECELDLPQDGAPFVDFQSLTKEQVIEWIKTKLMDQEQFFKTFTMKLVEDKLKTKPVSIPLPWSM